MTRKQTSKTKLFTDALSGTASLPLHAIQTTKYKLKKKIRKIKNKTIEIREGKSEKAQ